MFSKQLLCAAALCMSASAATLFNNGPLITHPGGGFGGADASRLQNSSLSLTNFGFGAADSANSRVADDFTIGGAGWQVESITVFGYQTNSGTTSTMDFGSLRIWNGNPSAGGVIVFGDTTTNRLSSSSFTNIYRDSETSVGNGSRPIMANTLDVGIFLTAGTYWVDCNLGGTLGSGPFTPAITILGNATTGNALQFAAGAWGPALDNANPQGIPFIVNGPDDPGVPEPSSFLLAAAGIIATVAARRRA